MAEIQPTLDLIDGALGDYLSEDAMRWTPDETERVESNPDRTQGLRPSRVWINDVEVTDYVTGMTIRDEVHSRVAANPTADGRSDSPPTVSEFRDAWNLMSSPETGRILDEVFARQMAETTPQPRLYGGEVGNLPGVQVYESPLVPEGQVVVVSAEMMAQLDWSGRNALNRIAARSEYDFQQDRYNLRIAAASELEAHRRVRSILSDSISRTAAARASEAAAAARLRHALNDCNESMRALKRLRMRYLHASYRHRSLARRRRNR